MFEDIKILITGQNEVASDSHAFLSDHKNHDPVHLEEGLNSLSKNTHLGSEQSVVILDCHLGAGDQREQIDSSSTDQLDNNQRIWYFSPIDRQASELSSLRERLPSEWLLTGYPKELLLESNHRNSFLREFVTLIEESTSPVDEGFFPFVDELESIGFEENNVTTFAVLYEGEPEAPENVGVWNKESGTHIFHLAGGNNLTMETIENYSEHLMKQLPQGSEVIEGATTDLSMGDSIRVSQIASVPIKEKSKQSLQVSDS